MRKRMPSKEEIERRAVELYMGENIGISDITPERHELQEEGFLRRAQHELMGTNEVAGVSYTSSKSQMREYLEQMATEMRLSIMPKREHREQLRKAEAFDIFRGKHPKQVKKVNGYKIVLPAIPQPTTHQVKRVKRQPKKPRKPKPIIPKVELPSVRDIAVFHSVVQDVVKKPKKKRKKNHTQRSGKTMRKLRKVKGVKVFSFPDHIWKVRK